MSAKVTVLLCGVALLAAVGLLAPIWHDEALVLMEFAGRDLWAGPIVSSAALKASLYYVNPGLRELFANVSRLHFQITPPFYYLAIWAWGQVVGHSLFALRLVSLGCWIGVLAVFNRWFPSRFALALLMLSPLGIEFASLARNYAMAVLWIMLTAYFFDPERRRGRKNIALACISATLAIWTHYFALFPIAIIFLWAICNARKIGKSALVAIAALAALTGIPLVKIAFGQLRPTGIPFPGTGEVFYHFLRILPRIALSPSLSTGRWIDMVSSLLFVTAILAAAVTFRTRSYKVRLCLLIVCGQAISLAALSLVMRSNLAQDRYLGLTLPFFYPLLADFFGGLSGITRDLRYLPLLVAAFSSGAGALELVQLERQRSAIANSAGSSSQLFVAQPHETAGVYAVLVHDIPARSDFVILPATGDGNYLDRVLPQYNEVWVCPSDDSAGPQTSLSLNSYPTRTVPVRLFREYACQKLSRPSSSRMPE